MKRFLAVYLGSEAAFERSGWTRLDAAAREAKQAAGMAAWHAWQAQHAAVLVDAGGPLGKTKRVARDGIADTKNAMSGYVIVEAESHEAAAKLFENHPHFAILPGESVEIMECMPIPGA
jgi:hypothetical protein